MQTSRKMTSSLPLPQRTQVLRSVRGPRSFKAEGHLPIIASIGGINSGGRTGGDNLSYRRKVLSSLSPEQRRATILEGLRLQERIHRVPGAPGQWRVLATGEVLETETVLGRFEAVFSEGVFIRDLPFRAVDEGIGVSFGASVPDGVKLESSSFGPKARSIPRTQRLALFAASDALGSLGVPWDEIRRTIAPDRIGIFFGSAMGQVGPEGVGGYAVNQASRKRVASTAVSFSLVDSPAAFLQSYLLGALSPKSCDVGACATFGNNMGNAVRAIQRGDVYVAIVGAADAALYPGSIAAYEAMTALATDAQLQRAGILKPSGEVDGSRACSPFSKNSFGMVMGESAQAVILMNPVVARQLGIDPLGAVVGVASFGDGFKGSISKPGVGLYAALGRALKSLARHFGEGEDALDVIRHRTVISAHGTSTPLNNVSESAALAAFAELWGTPRWPVTAPKSFIGHGLGAAGGDQLADVLGFFRDGILPRINNLAQFGFGDGVSRHGLEFGATDLRVDADRRLAAILVQQGFGANNTAFAVVGPEVLRPFFAGSEDSATSQVERRAQGQVAASRLAFESAWLEGADMIRYDATKGEDHPVVHGRKANAGEIELSRDRMRIPGIDAPLEF